MQNSVRRSEPGAGFFEEAPPAVPNSLLRLKVSGEKGADETVVYIDNQASDGYDQQLDASKMLGAAAGLPNLYTRAADSDLSINAISELTMDKKIPLDVVITHNGQHILEVMELVNFDPSVQVYLEDREKGLFHNLRTTTNLALDLKPGTSSGRFFLHLGQPVAVDSRAESCRQNDGQITVSNPSNHGWDVEVVSEQGAVLAQEEDLKSASRTFANLSDGQYQIRLTTADGYSTVKEATVAAGADFSAGFAAPQTPVLSGEAVSFNALIASSDMTYTWNFGDGTGMSGTPTATHSYNEPGIYKVSLLLSNGVCREISEQVITVRVDESATGIEESASNRYFSLYPNPANESVSISLKSTGRGELPELIEVMDATGRLVLRMDAAGMNEGGRLILPVKELASGSYQVSLITAKGRYTRPFVVAH
jgi:hypothetical protein